MGGGGREGRGYGIFNLKYPISLFSVFKSASTKGPGRGGTSHLTDFDETWPV